MNDLIEKIRKSRQQKVTVDGLVFTVKRPTDLEIVESRQKSESMRQSTILKMFVIDWHDFTQITLGIPGGTGETVCFNADLFMEWIADKPALWTPLTDAITGLYEQHVEQLGESEKKPEAG